MTDTVLSDVPLAARFAAFDLCFHWLRHPQRHDRHRHCLSGSARQRRGRRARRHRGTRTVQPALTLRRRAGPWSRAVFRPGGGDRRQEIAVGDSCCRHRPHNRLFPSGPLLVCLRGRCWLRQRTHTDPPEVRDDNYSVLPKQTQNVVGRCGQRIGTFRGYVHTPVHRRRPTGHDGHRRGRDRVEPDRVCRERSGRGKLPEADRSAASEGSRLRGHVSPQHLYPPFL